MSNLFHQQWTLSEQITLLTNIVQSTGQDVRQLLLRAMESGNIQPRWDEVALPAGRTLNSSRAMYDLLRAPPGPRSFSGPALSGGPYQQSPLAPYPPEGRGAPDVESSQPAQRPLQPRPPRSTDSPIPPTTNGEQFRILRPFAAPEVPSDKRRKRGRPTKEEAEERDRRLAESGQIYEPKKRPAKKPRPSETPSSLSEAFATTSPIMSTPRLQQIEPKEETSSSKRKSRRQREEGESSQQVLPKSPNDDSGDGRSTDAAQSPSDRLLARPERSQAVSSVSRDIQQMPSPYLEPHPGLRQDESPPPSSA